MVPVRRESWSRPRRYLGSMLGREEKARKRKRACLILPEADDRPYGFKPDELEQALVLMLQDEYPESATKPSTPVTRATPKPIGP